MGKIQHFYERLIYVGKILQDYLLLLLRFFWGWRFFQIGLGKLRDISVPAAAFNNLGIPLPKFFAYLVGGFEFIGGLMLFVGLMSRLFSIPLAFIMLVALTVAHTDAVAELASNPNNFISQMPITFLLVSLIVFCFGPGKFSIDYLIQKYVYGNSNSGKFDYRRKDDKTDKNA